MSFLLSKQRICLNDRWKDGEARKKKRKTRLKCRCLNCSQQIRGKRQILNVCKKDSLIQGFHHAIQNQLLLSLTAADKMCFRCSNKTVNRTSVHLNDLCYPSQQYSWPRAMCKVSMKLLGPATHDVNHAVKWSMIQRLSWGNNLLDAAWCFLYFYIAVN